MSNILTVFIDGIAYGMLLFLFSIGLSVTLGLMRFINLAHGAFAMCGGYLATTLINDFGVPFLASLPLAFIAVGFLGILIERTLIRHLYRMSALQQVLFSIGLVFAASALVNIAFGPQQQLVRLPSWLMGRMEILDVSVGNYRAFLIIIGAITALSLFALFNQTLFGARIRAAVDNRRAAEGVGIKVDRLFAITFGLGSALAGLGGALSVDFLGLDSTFPFKYLTIVLMVVAIGGPGSILGSFIAALFLGVTDVLFKYFVPEIGPFVIYALLVATLVIAPKGIAGHTA